MKHTYILSKPGVTPKDVRNFVRDHLDTHFCAENICDDVILAVSEVVTNAIQHANGVEQITLHIDDQIIRIEVSDNNKILVEVIRDCPDDAFSGRGLFIVETLSSAWGFYLHDTGKTVWVEIPFVLDEIAYSQRRIISV